MSRIDTFPEPNVRETLDLDLNDRVRLAPGISVTDTELHDDWLATIACPNRSAMLILRTLDGDGTTISDLIRLMIEEFEVEAGAARRQVLGVLESLDESAMLQVRRTLRSWLSVSALWDDIRQLFSLAPRRRPARRFAGTPFGVLRAVARQSAWPVAIGVGASISLAMLLMVQSGAGRAGASAAAAGSVILLLVVANAVLLYVHELGHLVALRVTGCGSRLVAARGLRIGLVFQRDAAHLRVVALSGPLAAFAVSVLLAWGGTVAPGLPLEALKLTILLGIGHLLSLGPWAADGRLLWGRVSARTSTLGEAS